MTLSQFGFQYRVKLDDGPPQTGNSPNQQPLSAGPLVRGPGAIRTATVAELAHATPDAVLAEIQTRARRVKWTKAYAATMLILALFLLGKPVVAVAFLVAACVPGYLIYGWDRDRRTARLFYDIDNEALVYRLAICNAAADALSRSSCLWHVYSSQLILDQKRNAGASAAIQRTATRCHPGVLDGIELNVEPWCIPVGPQQLLFLPDRLLVRQRNQYAAIPYEHLGVQFQESRFVEEGVVPHDAQRVDTTWRYVNKSGGPDRRFNNNRQYPILLYGKLTLSSRTGLNVVIQGSHAAWMERAANALQHLVECARPRRVPQALVGHTTMSGAGSSGERVSSPPGRAQVTSPPEGTNQPTLTDLSSIAVLLRYVAAADRRISATEVTFAQAAIREFARDDDAASVVGARFRGLKSNERDVLKAVRILQRRQPALLPRVQQLAAQLATVDGKVTPKEQERVAMLSCWLEACP